MTYSPIEFETYQRLSETGLSRAELLAMDMDEYARVTGRRTVGQIAAGVEDEPPGTPRQESAPTQAAPQPPAAEAPGIDINAMTLEQYAQLRGQLGVGGREYGRGIMDGGGTADWIAAAQAKGGRHGWQGGNVEAPPQLGRAFVQPDPLDTRSARERFSTPGNAFGS